MPPEITWGVILLVGHVLRRDARRSDQRHAEMGQEGLRQQRRAVEEHLRAQTWKRWALAFVGAIILEYAAGIAGGCTSGLAISGGMLLAPSAFLFIAGMFASGIVTAMIIYRKRY